MSISALILEQPEASRRSAKERKEQEEGAATSKKNARAGNKQIEGVKAPTSVKTLKRSFTASAGPNEELLEQTSKLGQSSQLEQSSKLEQTHQPHHSSMAQRTDLELLNAFQKGDERAFAELYVRRKSELYTFCLRMLGGDKDLASDAFQETLIKVYEKASTFRSGTNVMGWLFMIARNTCLNIHRAKRPMEDLDGYTTIASTDRSFAPEYRQEQGFLREILEEAIASLPHEFREPFILREFDGFSYEEIAKMTGTTLPMTKIRIHRAKQRMREILRPYLRDDSIGGVDAAAIFLGSMRDIDSAEE